MKTKRNGELFYEVYRYAARVTKMAKVIEKEGELTQEQYREWATDGLKNLDDIKEWIRKVATYIQGCQDGD